MSNEKWQQAIDKVLSHEGLFSNHKNDRGGPTKYGISLRYLKIEGMDIDGDGDVDIYDVLSIDKRRAQKIYKKEWWDKYKYDQILSPTISTKIFDLAVNMGSRQAHKIAQIAVNRIINHPIEVDGILGKESLGAINSLIIQKKEAELLNEIRENAAHYYVNLVADNPEYRVFLKGWLNRAND